LKHNKEAEMSTIATQVKSLPRAAFSLEEVRSLIERESDLLDAQSFDAWLTLYADDATYWVPAKPDQKSWLDHVSLYYDDRQTMKTRVARLNHPMIHAQEPDSRCVRLVSNFRIEEEDGEAGTCVVHSKFVMMEDRMGHPRRLFGGRYLHTIRREESGLKIVMKRVDITNCDQSFPMLTQPF
jgi:3-phenylpropionate/cinnamic acid dioxygenase small subunit